ncbi:MAG: aminotransferase class V-fold PLP-dependent enzyme [Gammaproteobacteria bacterium]|nr:MAG: aminotransferase class V-fold PLP-dependent enzyme [Gammaproteobacteria bacterium]
MSVPIYLDYAATTPVDPRVAEKMAACLTLEGNFANPASRSHMPGWRAEQAVEQARKQVADALRADPREIVWTSGATESDNLALKGLAWARGKPGHIVTTAIEHKAVLDTCSWLESQGHSVTRLVPDEFGRIEAEKVAQAIRPETFVVSVMHANNEVGTLNDIEAIGRVCRSAGVPFHVDAAQSAGKLLLDTRQLPVDMISISAHKIYGPKGIGCLYVRREADLGLVPLMHGGGHERGMRSGTLPTHQIVGFGEAMALMEAEREEEIPRLMKLRDRLWSALAELPGVYLNGHPEARLPGHINFSAEGVESETLLLALRDLAISSGSACTSASVEPSHVLVAMGLPRERALGALRISLGRFTSTEQVERAGELIVHALGKLRGQAV